MSDPLRIVVYPDRATWLEARRLAICSSDAAGIMGESTWSSAVQLNYLKRGLIPPSEQDPEREMDLDWHRRREAEIADWWWQRLLPLLTGPARPPEGAVLWDPGDYAVAYREVDGLPLAATCDRLVLRAGPLEEWKSTTAEGWPAWAVPQDHVLSSAELKNAHGIMARHWQDEPPLVYLLQVQHQIAVLRTSAAYIVASLGGQPPVWAWLQKDGEILWALRSTYRMFWDAVLDNRDVGADHREVTARAIASRYPADSGDTVALDRDALRKWKSRCSAIATIKDYTKQKSEAENELAQRIGAASFAKFPDGTLISYKKDKRGSRRWHMVSDPDEGGEDNGGFPF